MSSEEGLNICECPLRTKRCRPWVSRPCWSWYSSNALFPLPFPAWLLILPPLLVQAGTLALLVALPSAQMSQDRCGLIARHLSQRHSLDDLKHPEDEFISWMGKAGWKSEFTARLKTSIDFNKLRNKERDLLNTGQMFGAGNTVNMDFNSSPSLLLRLGLIP